MGQKVVDLCTMRSETAQRAKMTRLSQEKLIRIIKMNARLGTICIWVCLCLSIFSSL